MTLLDGPRPGRGLSIVLWVALALALYGALAVFGVGGLGEGVRGVPGNGFVGGFFVGLALFAVPAVAGWLLGRPVNITPAVGPRFGRVLVWVGLIGLALIGLLAVLVDVGFLEINVVVDS